MLSTNSNCGRRGHSLGTPEASAFSGNPGGAYLSRPKIPSRLGCLRPKTFSHLLNYADSSIAISRMKRLKIRKLNGSKMDLCKKKSPDYTEIAYREAVSKLKYLLAESYGQNMFPGKQYNKSIYQINSHKMNESGEDIDDRSIVSDSSRTKDLVGNLQHFRHSYLPPSNLSRSKVDSNLAFSATELQSIPPEITSFIERQEEYIAQLERESQYCRDELTNLLGKVREVVAENEALHSRNRNGFLQCALAEDENNGEVNYEHNKNPRTKSTFTENKKRSHKILEGPSIVFESRISELEAQLTQAKLELRKAQEENRLNLKRLSEGCSNVSPEIKIQLEQALRAKTDAELKLDELQKTLSITRDREVDAIQKAKRSLDAVQQMEFDKNQYEIEIKRLKEELERQHEKLRGATQDANKRIADERQHVERRYSQQVEQLSADVASHWDTASKCQLESEKQRRELLDLKRDLSQKQTFIDNLKKELQSKISNLQSDLNQALAEKDAADQEVLATKLSSERTERQARQEQSRLQAEINSYKQRLERTDADLLHCRRENLRLSEQIASLEKEINMNKLACSDDSRVQVTPRLDNEKELTSMIMDMETKHAATVAGLEDALSNQATLVSQLTAECQSLTQRLEANSLKHKEEMASLQSNIKYLTTKIQDTFGNDREHYRNSDQDQNVQQDYTSNKGNLDSYIPEQYNQYEPYDSQQYEDQQYADHHYDLKETHSEPQCSVQEQENKSDTFQ